MSVTNPEYKPGDPIWSVPGVTGGIRPRVPIHTIARMARSGAAAKFGATVARRGPLARQVDPSVRPLISCFPNHSCLARSSAMRASFESQATARSRTPWPRRDRPRAHVQASRRRVCRMASSSPASSQATSTHEPRRERPFCGRQRGGPDARWETRARAGGGASERAISTLGIGSRRAGSPHGGTRGSLASHDRSRPVCGNGLGLSPEEWPALAHV